MRATSICLLIILFVSKCFAGDADTTIITPPFVTIQLPQKLPFQLAGSTLTNYTSTNIKPDYYLSCLGFFCKKEWLIEQKTKIPLRLRLGSLAYTNSMEQKAATIKHIPSVTVY